MQHFNVYVKLVMRALKESGLQTITAMATRVFRAARLVMMQKFPQAALLFHLINEHASAEAFFPDK